MFFNKQHSEEPAQICKNRLLNVLHKERASNIPNIENMKKGIIDLIEKYTKDRVAIDVDRNSATKIKIIVEIG